MMYWATHDTILPAIVTMDKEGFAFYFATSSIFVVEKEGLYWNHMGCMEPSNNAQALERSCNIGLLFAYDDLCISIIVRHISMLTSFTTMDMYCPIFH